MLTNFFNDFFHPISIVFLGLLIGAATIGLGVGYWIWGTLARRLAVGYDRISTELTQKNRASNNKTDNSDETIRLRKFARQVEEERNRLLVDNNLYQKQGEKLTELEHERNQLWQELLDVKEQLYSHESAEKIDWQVENKSFRQLLINLKAQNENLQNDLDTQLDYLKNQLLAEADAHDESKLILQQLQINFAAISQERTDWKTRYEEERSRSRLLIGTVETATQPQQDVIIKATTIDATTIDTATIDAATKNTEEVSSQLVNTVMERSQAENYETTPKTLQAIAYNKKNESKKNEENKNEDNWQANDASLAESRKNEVRQLLEDRWLTISPDDSDKLQRISGIGPILEQRLNDIGIYSFEQLSRLDDFLVQKVAEALECLPQRIINDNWIGQAKVLSNK